MAYSSSDIQKALADPGASGPGGIYNQIRASMGSSGSSGATPVAAAPAPAPPRAPVAVSQQGEPIYNTVNGPRTPTQMMNELFAVGWNGSGEIKDVYARTTGGGVSPSGSTSPGGANPIPAGMPGVPQNPGQISLDPNSLQALTNFGNAAGTMSAAELAERKRQFDQTLEWSKQMWQNQGLPQLVIAQRAQQMQQEEFQFQMQMAQKNLALSEAGVTGLYNGAPTEAAREFNAQNTLAQQNLAADVLKTQASLSGPANWVQAANYARGLQQTNIPAFMNSLLTGAPTTATGVGAGLSAPLTLSGLAAQAGAGDRLGTVASPDVNGTLNMGRALFAAGGGALGPQALEGLSDTERGMLQSVGGAVGGDYPTFLNQYARTRIGQGAAQAG
jgi:hypothetical protein